MNAEEIESKIRSAINVVSITVQDPLGDGSHVSVQVVSDDFKDKSPIQRHKMVYNAIGNDVGNKIHALSIRALSTDEVKI